MGHAYNNGLHTSSKGITYDKVRVTHLNSGTPVITEDCKSGLIASVAATATGTFTFQLSLPYPPILVTCEPKLSAAAANSAILTARYKEGSYSASAGTFVVLISDATPVAANPATDTVELHVGLAFNRYTR